MNNTTELVVIGGVGAVAAFLLWQIWKSLTITETDTSLAEVGVGGE